MSLLKAQTNRYLLLTFVAAVLFVSFITNNNYRNSKSFDLNVDGARDHSRQFVNHGHDWGKRPAPKPANRTLDFQEILYVSLPYRTDRQDAMSLVASVTDLKLKMIPGVSVDEIHPKAEPGHVGSVDWTGKPWLGVWRAHANVWRYIIDNDIQSALILEDDVDWDVNIKEIMGNMNWQLRYNNTIRWGKDVEKGWKEDCPYGCDWDQIFVGQCLNTPNEERLDLHAVVPDPHSPPISRVHEEWKNEFNQFWNLTDTDGVRVLSPTYEPVCLMGYALTRLGAMRLLYHIGGWQPMGQPVDIELRYRTKEGKMSGYVMTPPAFVPWRLNAGQDSDNHPEDRSKEINKLGMTAGGSIGLKDSARESLDRFFYKNYWDEAE